jgi:hypothetical protein
MCGSSSSCDSFRFRFLTCGRDGRVCVDLAKLVELWSCMVVGMFRVGWKTNTQRSWPHRTLRCPDIIMSRSILMIEMYHISFYE